MEDADGGKSDAAGGDQGEQSKGSLEPPAQAKMPPVWEGRQTKINNELKTYDTWKKTCTSNLDAVIHAAKRSLQSAGTLMTNVEAVRRSGSILANRLHAARLVRGGAESVEAFHDVVNINRVLNLRLEEEEEEIGEDAEAEAKATAARAASAPAPAAAAAVLPLQGEQPPAPPAEPPAEAPERAPFQDLGDELPARTTAELAAEAEAERAAADAQSSATLGALRQLVELSDRRDGEEEFGERAMAVSFLETALGRFIGESSLLGPSSEPDSLSPKT